MKLHVSHIFGRNVPKLGSNIHIFKKAQILCRKCTPIRISYSNFVQIEVPEISIVLHTTSDEKLSKYFE